MARIFIALLATLAFATMSLEAAAQEKKTCPAGKVYDPDKGKCVTPRGSY